MMDFHFAPGETILHSLSPMLDKLTEGDKVKFTVRQLQSFEVTLTTDDGFEYAITPQKISVTFKHRLRAKAVSGGDLPLSISSTRS
jgi:hypothetical protein